MNGITLERAIAIAMSWSYREPWEIARTFLRDWKRAKESADTTWKSIAEEERRDERRFGDEWFRLARADAKMQEHAAEICRKQLLAFYDELLSLENYCRLNAPGLAPLIPRVDFFVEVPTDFEGHIEALRELESELRIGEAAAKEGERHRKSSTKKGRVNRVREVAEAVSAAGPSATPRRVKNHLTAGMQEQAFLQALRQLEKEGKYKGFSRKPRKAR